MQQNNIENTFVLVPENRFGEEVIVKNFNIKGKLENRGTRGIYLGISDQVPVGI